MAEESIVVFLKGQISDFKEKMSAAGAESEEFGTKSSSSFSKFSSLSSGALLAVGVAALAVGSYGVKMADEYEASHARLETAVKNSGGDFEKLTGQVSATDKTMENLGFTNADTESSIATLTGATHSAKTAMGQEALAADISRARKIDLASATSFLVKVDTGHVSLLGKLGINIKDVNGKTIDQTTALKRLSDLYGGNASAYTETFAGKLAVLKTKGEDIAKNIGLAVIPVIEDFASITLDAVHVIGDINDATDGWAGKLVLLGAGGFLAFGAVVKVTGAVSSLATTLGIGTAATSASTVAMEAEATATLEAAAARGALLSLPAAAAELEVAAATEAVAVADEHAAAAAAALAAAQAEEGVSMLAVLGPAALVVAGIVGIGFALNHFFGGDNDDSKIKALSADLLKSGDAAKQAATQLAQIVSPQTAAAIEQYSNQLLAGASSEDLAKTKAAALSSEILANGGNFVKAHDQIDTATKSLDDNVAKMGAAGVQTAALSAAQKQYADHLASGHASEARLASDRQTVITLSGQQAAVQDKVTSATQAGTQATGDATAAAAKQAAAETALATALKKVNDLTVTAAGDDLSLQQATLQVGDAADTFKQKLIAASKAKNDDGVASRAAQEAQLSLRSSILGAVTAAQSDAKAHVDLTSKATGTALAIEEENAKHRAAKHELDVLTVTYPGLRDLVEQYRVQLGLIPATVDTAVHLNIPAAVYAGTANGANFKGPHAAGGTIGPGEVGTAGEAGWEFIEGLPGGGARVYPHSKSKAMIAGGGRGTVAAPSIDELHLHLHVAATQNMSQQEMMELFRRSSTPLTHEVIKAMQRWQRGNGSVVDALDRAR